MDEQIDTNLFVNCINTCDKGLQSSMKVFVFWLSVFTIFYAYIGYPTILFVLARIIGRPVKISPVAPSVTLLIAAYNEEDVIAKKIQNSLELNYPKDKLRIIVAANGSTDQTVEIVNSFSNKAVELSYDAKREGKMAAINNAMQIIKSDIVVFSDANNMYERDALNKLVMPFSDNSVGGVSGSKLIIANVGESLSSAESTYWRYESFIKKQESILGSCVGAVGEIFAIRRKLFVPPAKEIINDDFWMALQVVRQGYRMVYEPLARSLEHSSPSEKEESTRRVRIVAGRYQAIRQSLELLPFRNPFFIWQTISHKFLRPLIPVLLIFALLTNISLLSLDFSASISLFSILNLKGVYAWFMLGAQSLVYFLAWLGSWLKSRGIPVKGLYVFTYFVSSNFSSFVGLLKFVTGKQTVIWQRASRRK